MTGLAVRTRRPSSTAPAGAATVGTGPPPRERWIALGVLCAGFLMVILDSTIVNVALPSIQTDLRFSQSGLAWVVNAYLIPFGGLLLLAGRLGDLLGRRGMFVAGLAVFTAASLLCGLAESAGELIAARFVQGVGGAMTSAVILGMIVTRFPEPGDRARAIGAYAFVGSAGASLGLVLGGVLTQALDWHWIFFVNVPIGIATAVAARRVLERDAGLGLRGGADVPGAALITGALTLGVFTIVGGQDHGWASARTLGGGAVALALLGAFVAWEQRAPRPLVALRIFRTRSIAAANTVQVLMIAGFFGQQFLLALYLQRVLGFDAIELGLGVLPVALAIGTMSLGFSARLMARFGPKATYLPAVGLAAAGLLVLSRVPADGRYSTDVLPGLILMGLGAGLAMPALTTIGMADAAPADAGLASGLINTTQQVGAALGLAIVATLSATHTDHLLTTGASTTSALTSGYRLGFTLSAAFTLAALAVGAALLPGRGRVAR